MGDHTDEAALPKWPQELSDIRKLVIYLALAGAGAYATLRGQDLQPLVVLLDVVIAIVGALGVYYPSKTWLKTVTVVVTAALQALVNLAAAGFDLGHLNLDQWWGVIAAGIAVVTTGLVPDTFTRQEDVDRETAAQ